MTTNWPSHGGEDKCPSGVAPDAVVETRFSDGSVSVNYANRIHWQFVISYNVVRPGEEQERETVVWINFFANDDQVVLRKAQKYKKDADASAENLYRVACKRVVIKWRPGEFDEEPK